MKLLRYGESGKERPAVLVGENLASKNGGHLAVDVGDLVHDFDADFFESGGLERLAQSDLGHARVHLDEIRVGPPVARPRKLVCIGLNYVDHAREAGAELPQEPTVFFKATNTVVGPYDDLLIPVGSQRTDWEVELAIVLGQEARYLPDEDAAADVIAGYCLSHDVSERAFQLDRGGQWVKGKSCETFNPLGPWLATPDEFEGSPELEMSLWVNGERRQHSNTAQMVFRPSYVAWYLSQFMVLEPGDVINTGTPAGVGLGLDPPAYLQAGDTVDLAIEGLGRQRQVCRQATSERKVGGES